MGAAIALAAGIAMSACTDSSAPSSAATRGSNAGPDVATLGPPATIAPAPTSTQPDDTTPVALDSSLLAVLPSAVGNIPVVEDNDEAATALRNPALPRIATAVDAAVAVDAGAGNLVYAWVVKLRPGAFTLGAFSQWRDSYDQGACAASGGVVGTAQAEIAGRTTYITTCARGLRAYHVWLEDRDLLVSAASIGDGRFGEQLMAGLRVPA